MDDQCDCTACHVMRLAEEVAELRERIAAIEESRSLEVLGVVAEDGKVEWLLEEGKVVWRDERMIP